MTISQSQQQQHTRLECIFVETSPAHHLLQYAKHPRLLNAVRF